MEVMSSVSVVIVLVLVYAFGVWWKDGRTWQPLKLRVGQRLRSAFDAVSRDEMRELENFVQSRQQDWEARIAKLEATAKFSNQLHSVSKEIEQRLTQLELPEAPSLSSESVQRPRSLVRLGVRWTISDGLWAQLGVAPAEEMEDQLLDSLVQGPFCQGCLKRLVGRGQSRLAAVVPEPCRYCGVSWDFQGAVDHSILAIDLKRRVYDQLDREYRVRGTLP